MNDNSQHSETEFSLRRSVKMIKEDPEGAREAFSAAAKTFCPHCGVKHRTKTPEQCYDERMTESTLQRRVVARAKKRGWVVKHVGKGLTGENGVWVSTAKNFPDLFLLHEGQQRAMAMELKRQKGDFEPGQLEYLRLLNVCGIPAVVIRPSDLRDGTVNAILGPQ
jgi:hypothetical protein